MFMKKVPARDFAKYQTDVQSRSEEVKREMAAS
jgi:hypothetical protein